MKRYIFYIFLFSFFITSCKKYEENPLINLRSKNHRVEGRYRVAFYSINGVNHTAEVNDSLLINGAYGYIGFLNSSSVSGYYEIGGSFLGIWRLSKNKKYLHLQIGHSSHSIEPFVNQNPNDWIITKLTENHLHLKISIDNNDYVLQLHEYD